MEISPAPGIPGPVAPIGVGRAEDSATRAELRAAHDRLEFRVAALGLALQAARSENDRLAAAIASTDTGVVISDPNQPDAPIVFVNPAFRTMTGYAPEEVLGRNCRFLQGPATDRAIVTQMRAAQRERRPFRGVVRNYRKDGTPFWNELTINPVFADGGELVSFVGVQTDVTDRVEALEQARQSEARLARAQRVARVGSWEGTFTDGAEPVAKLCRLVWSEETFRIFGHSPNTADDLWNLFHARVHPGDRDAVRDAFTAAIRTRRRFRLDHRIVRPDGTKRVVHEEADIIFDEASGQPLRVVGTVQDITETAFAADIGRHLTEARELPEMLGRCTQSMVDHLGAAFARIWTLNETGDTLELVASSGLYTHLDGAHGRVPVGQFKIGLIASERKPHLTNQVQGDPRVPEQAWARAQGLVAFAGYPLIVDERLVGVMAMFSRQPLPASTLDAMASVARHIALGIERKHAGLAAARLATIVASSDDAIIGKTLDGTITSWNRGAEDLYGHTAAEALGQSCLELLVPPDLRAEEEHILRAIARGERVAPCETVWLRKGGVLVHVSLAVSPVTDATGAVVAASSISRDITARKQAEQELFQSRETLRVILDNIPQRVFWKDRNHVFLGCNQAFAIDRGFEDPAEVIGKTDFDINSSSMAERYRADERSVMAQNTARSSYEEPVIFPGGQPAWLRTSKTPLHDAQGRVIGILGTYEDVTEHKLAKLEIERLNANLEQRVAQRTEDLAVATREAERANHAKSEFLSRTSHELRTPMNAILGFGQLLDMEEDLAPHLRESVEQILNAGRHLLALIDEVLDISNAESGSIPLSLGPVAVAPLVEEALGLVRPLGTTLQVVVEPSPPPGGGWEVQADAKRLRQVLLNLLSNAIKYNRPGGKVTVTYAHDPAVHPTTLRLCVQDTGPGISPENLARLFTPFDRLDAERTRAHIVGTGLGLALSKRIVALMGGALGVQSVVGEGSTFWIELPVAGTG